MNDDVTVNDLLQALYEALERISEQERENLELRKENQLLKKLLFG